MLTIPALLAFGFSTDLNVILLLAMFDLPFLIALGCAIKNEVKSRKEARAYVRSAMTIAGWHRY